MTDSLWPHLHVSEDECNKFKLSFLQSTDALGGLELGHSHSPGAQASNRTFILQINNTMKKKYKAFSILQALSMAGSGNPDRKNKNKVRQSEETVYLYSGFLVILSTFEGCHHLIGITTISTSEMQNKEHFFASI